MTKRQLHSKIKYLRKLYSEMEEISNNAKTTTGKVHGQKAVDHLQCSVVLLINVFEAEFKYQ